MRDTKTPDRVAGNVKQVVAEIIGDGDLAEEGKDQAGRGPAGTEPSDFEVPADQEHSNKSR